MIGKQQKANIMTRKRLFKCRSHAAAAAAAAAAAGALTRFSFQKVQRHTVKKISKKKIGTSH
jgi:hypothetical protein